MKGKDKLPRRLCLIQENHNQMNEKNLRILVLGSGGREHTLAKICSKSPLVDEVLVAPGNGGIQKEFRTLDLSVEDNSKIVEIAKAENIDLVVVGPEVPLCNGVVDDLSQNGILAYGPTPNVPDWKAVKLSAKTFWPGTISQPLGMETLLRLPLQSNIYTNAAYPLWSKQVAWQPERSDYLLKL